MYDLSHLSPEDAAYFREKGYLRQTPELEAQINDHARRLNAELAPHRATLDRNFAAWRDEIEKLFARDHEAIGRVLKHHLILEDRVTRHLEAVAPRPDWRRARLRFAQKLDLIPKDQGITDSIVRGIREINGVRNNLGHQIAAQPALQDLRECVRLLGLIHPYFNNTYSDALHVIEDFTQLVCGSLPVDAETMKIFRDAEARVGPWP